ncbi:hypothetical protein CRI94_09425 [Longibacter salinarum]|uniref:AMP-activated protein kinase glycogen-binding domain-containing protein n=1 Tax=Longibacter salinarum TaxID=1850348 RepID=A0A2A8CY46_9BACT|nr:glycogen-binding domain-containing protein [Longibacter salinarum]PEN13524.1 hypothetical protein CRI94_09425 [Longibacter salinarum]
MRYALLGLGLLLWSTCLDARAQVLYTTVGADAEAGAQSNPYLDPLLGEWDPTADPRFASITPIGAITWDTPQWQVQAFARTRLYPRRTETPNPQFAQGGMGAYRLLSSRWRVGIQGGIQRYQLNASRDTGWLMSSVRWAPLKYTTITLAGGLSRRMVRTFDPAQKQTSALGTLSLQSWLTDNIRGTARIYVSDGRAGTSAASYGGTGGSIGVRLLLSPTVTATVRGTAERLFTELNTTTPREQVDLIGRAHIGVDWQATPSVELFAAGQGMIGDVNNTDVRDRRVALGLRYRWRTTLYDATESHRRKDTAELYCLSVEGGARFRVRYEGDGRPYITGDFNGWELPGVGLSRTQPQGDMYTVTLPLPTGRFEYRIHHSPKEVRETGSNPDDSNSSPSWMTLPSGVPTTNDAFGGENGVCVIP